MMDPFLAELEQEAQTTRRVLERVPGDKLSWKPHAKSMSLGQLATHVATIPGVIAQILVKDSLDLSGFEEPAAKSAAELIPSFNDGLRTAREILGSMEEQKLLGTWKLTGNGKELLAMPRLAVVRSVLLNHWYHHRGQLSVYLRLLDVPVPSIYGPSADENPFASA